MVLSRPKADSSSEVESDTPEANMVTRESLLKVFWNCEPRSPPPTIIWKISMVLLLSQRYTLIDYLR